MYWGFRGFQADRRIRGWATISLKEIATATPTFTAAAATPTQTPITGAVVPTLSFPMLALLGLALAGAALMLIRGT